MSKGNHKSGPVVVPSCWNWNVGSCKNDAEETCLDCCRELCGPCMEKHCCCEKTRLKTRKK